MNMTEYVFFLIVIFLQNSNKSSTLSDSPFFSKQDCGYLYGYTLTLDIVTIFR